MPHAYIVAAEEPAGKSGDHGKHSVIVNQLRQPYIADTGRALFMEGRVLREAPAGERVKTKFLT